jgi:hypothetical protein
MGYKAQLGRVLSILRASLDGNGAPSPKILLDIKEKVLALNEEVDPARLEELQDQFTDLNSDQKRNFPNFIKGGLRFVKSTLTKEIDTFTRENQRPNAGSTREWLVNTKERYEKLLSAL